MPSPRLGRCVAAVGRANFIIDLGPRSSQLNARCAVMAALPLRSKLNRRQYHFQATQTSRDANKPTARDSRVWALNRTCGARSSTVDLRRVFTTTSVAPAAVEDSRVAESSSTDQSKSASRSTAPPEVESSLDSLLPDNLFDPSESQSKAPSSIASSAAPPRINAIGRSLARTIVSLVLQQLRSGLETTARQDAQARQRNVDEAVRAAAQQAGVSAEALHQFSIDFMKSSRDPRRMPIASRLFVAAFGIDPLSLVDPTAPTEATSHMSPPPTQLLAGPDAWGVNAAGYNWASMVLSGQASPPPGLHLLQRGSDEAREMIKEQQAAAIRVYATLAMRGDGQGMLGMGRILLASIHRSEGAGQSDQTGAADDATKAKQALDFETTRNRVVALWTRAGEKGVADAWFELGILSLGLQESGGEKAQAAAKAAEDYFDKGAKAGSSQCHHALGVMHTQHAMQSQPESPNLSSSSSSPARKESLEISMEHFRQAAELGDGQSAHHVAMRYLLREEMIEETSLGSESDGRSPQAVRQQAISRHTSLWGTVPDDGLARHWFSKGADAGFMPAMMNLAGMLFESRGQTDQHHANVEGADNARLRDLRKAESLYAKVAAQASVLAQQQQQHQGAAAATNMQGGTDATAEMASFAQQALGTVQEAIKQLVAK